MSNGNMKGTEMKSTTTLRMLTIALLLVPTIACSQPAQQAAPTPPPVEVNLKVTLSEAEILWKALRKLPVEEVEQLMGKIRQQVSEQTQIKPETPK